MSVQSERIRLVKAGEAAEKRRQAQQTGEPIPAVEPVVEVPKRTRRKSKPQPEGNRLTTIFGGETKLLKLLEKRGGSVTIQIGPPQADETDRP
jgi:hypothetical protein